MIKNLFKGPHFLRTIKWIGISLLLMIFPAIASAGWLDFIGTAARAGADAYIHTIYINAVERQIVTISFLIYSLLATIQGVAAWMVIKNFRIAFSAATKDNVISWLEGIALGIQGFVTILVCVGLMVYSGFLFYIVYDGLNEIRSFQGLEYSSTIGEDG